jgi:hypothetical protein
MSKSFLTEFRLELSCLLSLLFGFLTTVGIVGAFFKSTNGGVVTYHLPKVLGFLGELADPFGQWVAYLVVVGPIGLVICLWWLYDYVRKTRELASLIDTSSRAKFVRNLDDIEYLGWALPQRFEDKVLKKKKEFKL